ncbi:double-stranded DNA-binding domain-containing protein [Pseudovirgaria hyperparasitica]|uniref:Double-stranded DNA-binding domain-containing protein n=1 Tax=Pseudovirgaria hyperparasitica TaxID=470096 RepID=A0A6A6W3Y2_9PEZI|nr:double-stranded DNA-binding domain-containing protein [Pseudovirgaria hyperparasitica]KAF2757562.1 double-stranded DNA-binding domain-containing protein [Pseudovirgaria hyperparasitica]
MADEELEQIRKARLEQFRQQGGASGGEGQNKEDVQREREANARASMIAQILLPDAQDRLNRIRLVNATRAKDVEDRLIFLAQQRQLPGRVNEEQLKQLLGAVAEQKEEEKITVQRKGSRWDDDDDLLEGL